MISLKRILLPTDFSEYSAAARNYACAFCDQFHAELHVLHVIQDLAPLAPEPGVMLPPPADYLKEIEDNATLMLERVIDPQWAAGKTITAHRPARSAVFGDCPIRQGKRD